MSRKRLLIIDGDEAFAREVADVAERRGFDTTICATSVEGLELALSQRPDLVVVNVELAPTNGWSVCIKLKKDEALQHIPVVLTSSTSTADTFEKHRKLRTRADDYLLKPYQPEQLLELAGQLVGWPDVDEPLVEINEDAPGFEDEYELEGDDAFAIEGDEPLGEVEFESEDAFAALDDEQHDPLAADPLADGSEWDADPLGDPLAVEAGEEEVAFDEEVEPLPEPVEQEEALEEFARGEFATAEFSAGALAAATAALRAEAAQEAPIDPLADEYADPLADDEWGAEEVDPLAAFDDDTDFEAEVAAFAEETDASADGGFASEASLEAEPFPDALPEDGGYDEAPLEVPAADAVDPGEEALIEELGSALDEGDFDLGDEVVGLGQGALAGAELARMGELEAELDGLRAAEAAGAEEIGRLRNDLAARDESIFDLRSQLESRERELRELTASHTTEVSRAAAEKARREATVRSLTTRGEQLTAALRKAERELASVRENAARLPELETKLTALEGELETAREQAFQVASLQDRIAELEAAAERDQAALTTERDAALADLAAARTEADGLRNDLDEARRTAERALENTGTLQEKLAEANERVEAAELRVKALERANSQARDTLLQLVENLGTA